MGLHFISARALLNISILLFLDGLNQWDGYGDSEAWVNTSADSLDRIGTSCALVNNVEFLY